MKKFCNCNDGQSLVELLLAIGLSALLLPIIFVGIMGTREGKAQQNKRLEATNLLTETQEAVRNVRENGWSNFSTNGTFYPAPLGSSWALSPGASVSGSFTKQIEISDVYRDTDGNITTSGTLDPSTKKIVTSVTWNSPLSSSIQSVLYLTRYLENNSFADTCTEDFNAGGLSSTQVVNSTSSNSCETSSKHNGEIQLINNNKAKWCSPAFSSSTIDLPDGPPVAVAATADTTDVNIPNDVFVATSPYATSSVKLAYLNITANTEIPTPTLRGTFTLDPAKYSNPSYLPSGINLINNFKTNDVKYYKSSSGKLYALMGTNLPDHEVIAILINDGASDVFQDPVNKIYGYWTFFNTRQYQGDTRSTPNQDQSPFGYGAVALNVFGDRGYVISSGYLYVFNLSNIDSKSTSNGLDMIGCRIQLDGYDCSPGTGVDRKYSSNQTGAAWGDTTTPAHNDCSDGGNIELYADNAIYPVLVGGNTYVYVAVGAGTNPEFNIVNATNVPSMSTSPRINSSSCGRIYGGNAGWRRISSLDFNTQSQSEEAANSVYAKSDGTRAYISSNGGIDSNGNGQPDSYQLYVLDTTNKSSPRFLSGTSSPPTSGYYYGGIVTPTPAGPAYNNEELFPRRSLTVLNGERAILVGKDGFSNSNNPQEYQVLNISSELSPNYCGGIDFDSGFNDLTSVSEADGDNFVYMVANTNEKQLKIIQGGPDNGIYTASGTFDSSIFDVQDKAGLPQTAFNGFTAIINQSPPVTTVRMQVAVAPPVSGSCIGANYNFVGPNGISGDYFTSNTSSISGAIPFGDFGGYQNPNRCFRYRAYLDTTDTTQTPSLYDLNVNYSP